MPQKDQMDHWRHFPVSRGPKVDNGSHDGSHRDNNEDQMDYLRL